jgi:hypothetical protein
LRVGGRRGRRLGRGRLLVDPELVDMQTRDLKVLDLEVPHNRSSDRQPAYRQGADGARSNGHGPDCGRPTRAAASCTAAGCFRWRPSMERGRGDRRWLFMTDPPQLDNHVIPSLLPELVADTCGRRGHRSSSVDRPPRLATGPPMPSRSRRPRALAILNPVASGISRTAPATATPRPAGSWPRPPYPGPSRGQLDASGLRLVGTMIHIAS